MDSNLKVRYQNDPKDQTGYDLGVLGNSFVGFNDVFKELFEISQIQGDFSIKATKISEGSIDVLNCIQVSLSSPPFNNPADLIEFLQVVDKTYYLTASDYFNAIGNGHKGVNDFFREHQFASNIITNSVGGVISGLLVTYLVNSNKWAGKQKKVITTKDSNGKTISERTARKLQSIVRSGKYKRALSPLSTGSVSSIYISQAAYKSSTTVFDEKSLEQYLPEKEKILPELENGTRHKLTGIILALQSTKGDILKIRINNIDPRFQLLTAHPTDEMHTEDFKDFYKKNVNIEVEVYRKTLFNKPELIIRKIELMQDELF